MPVHRVPSEHYAVQPLLRGLILHAVDGQWAICGFPGRHLYKVAYGDRMSEQTYLCRRCLAAERAAAGGGK